MTAREKIEGLTNSWYGYAVFGAVVSLWNSGIGLFSLLGTAVSFVFTIMLTWFIGRRLLAEIDAHARAPRHHHGHLERDGHNRRSEDELDVPPDHVAVGAGERGHARDRRLHERRARSASSRTSR